MAITTSAELNTALGNWLARSDLSSRIPEFVSLAEGMLRADLVDIVSQETKTASFSITGEYVTVPTGYEGTRSLHSTRAGVRFPIDFMPEASMDARFDGTTGVPIYYCYVAGNLRFSPPPDATYTATLVYFVGFTALAGGSDTNWILTNWPNAYLMGSMAMAMTEIQDDTRIANFMGLYKAQIQAILSKNNRMRYNAPGLQIRPG